MSKQKTENNKNTNLTDEAAVKKIKIVRSKLPSTQVFVDNIRKGNISYLSRAITLVESTKKEHQKKSNCNFKSLSSLYN